MADGAGSVGIDVNRFRDVDGEVEFAILGEDGVAVDSPPAGENTMRVSFNPFNWPEKVTLPSLAALLESTAIAAATSVNKVFFIVCFVWI